MNDVGVPVSLLKEFVNKTITVDTHNGEIFTGTLVDAQDNLSMNLEDVNTTFASGHTTNMESVYIKGHKIRYIALPEKAKSRVVELHREMNRPPSRGRGGSRGGRGGRGGGRPSFRGRRY
ncbi:sm domain-containing protein [Caerostris darwini]|uniref:Sm domain-containing protein n=1 Tax=Caerostris darwini TaxID=1538125 RepID=A0AAV4W426_9ARAC|nr:sm domain-containing protein [Caerostris darwini]